MIPYNYIGKGECSVGQAIRKIAKRLFKCTIAQEWFTKIQELMSLVGKNNN